MDWSPRETRDRIDSVRGISAFVREIMLSNPFGSALALYLKTGGIEVGVSITAKARPMRSAFA
jgi:hypothetical protein